MSEFAIRATLTVDMAVDAEGEDDANYIFKRAIERAFSDSADFAVNDVEIEINETEEL